MDKNKIAVALFDKVASLYEQKFMDVGLYHVGLDFFLERLPQNAELLEAACGPGNLTKYLLEKRPDLKILATDLAPNMLALAKINNPSAEFLELDCRAVLSVNRNFDAISCGFALPYLSSEETQKFITDAAHALNPGGLLYLSAIEGDYAGSTWKSGRTGDKIFQYHYSAGDLRQFLLQASFQELYFERVSYPGPENSTVNDLVLIAKKP